MLKPEPNDLVFVFTFEAPLLTSTLQVTPYGKNICQEFLIMGKSLENDFQNIFWL